MSYDIPDNIDPDRALTAVLRSRPKFNTGTYWTGCMQLNISGHEYPVMTSQRRHAVKWDNYAAYKASGVSLPYNVDLRYFETSFDLSNKAAKARKAAQAKLDKASKLADKASS